MDFCDLRVKDVHGVVIYDTDMTHWSAKNRKDHIVGIKMAGSAKHTFQDREFVISRNCVYFLNRNEDYDVEVYERGESFSIHFTTYEEIDTDSFCVSVSTPEAFASVLEKAKTAQNTNDGLLLFSLLYQFCARLEQLRQKKYFPKDKRMLAAKAYIDENFNRDDCLAAAVAQSKLTTRRFDDLFRKSFDITPNKYIMFRRVAYAKTLLVAGMFSVAAVAEMCGFSDVYYFSKVFKKLTGVNPSKWTQQL